MILPLPSLVTFSPCLFLHLLRLPTSYLTPFLSHILPSLRHPPPPSLTPPSPFIASITSSSILLYRLRHFILVCSPTPPYSPPSLTPPSSFVPPPFIAPSLPPPSPFIASVTSSSILVCFPFPCPLSLITRRLLTAPLPPSCTPSFGNSQGAQTNGNQIAWLPP